MWPLDFSETVEMAVESTRLVFHRGNREHIQQKPKPSPCADIDSPPPIDSVEPWPLDLSETVEMAVESTRISPW